MSANPSHTQRKSITESTLNSHIGSYGRRIGILVCLISLTIGHIRGQSRREYIYMGDTLLAVEELYTTGPLISNISSTDITDTSATISWTTDKLSDSQVEYGQTVGYGNCTTLDGSMATSHSQELTGLSPNTLYHYRVKSGDSDGNPTLSEDCTFTTLNASALRIMSIASSGITGSSATILWTTNLPSDSQVEYGQTAGYGSSTTLSGSMMTSHSQELTGLNANTLYHYRVKSRGSDGALVASEDLTFNTQSPVVMSLFITSPTSEPGTSTTQNSIDIGGSWSGGTGIPQITFDNNRGGYGSCSIVDELNRQWMCSNITLQTPDSPATQLDNVITITAMDDANNEATDVLTVNQHLDGTIPAPTWLSIDWKASQNRIDVSFCIDPDRADHGYLEMFWRTWNSGGYTSMNFTELLIPGSGCLAFPQNMAIHKNNVYTYRVQGAKYAADQTESRGPWSTRRSIRTRYTIDDDLKADPTVWRPSTGVWDSVLSNHMPDHDSAYLGESGDIPMLGNYDDDTVTDRAVWRPSTGTWYIFKSSALNNPPAITQWGMEGDIPVPGDYDFDSKTDIAIYRPGTGYWYILKSSEPGTFDAVQWGALEDVPVPADYDADGKTDIAVWRPSTGIWYILSSKYRTYTATQWGAESDKPVQADYDGDGKTDIAVWRPSTGYWYILRSSEPGTYDAVQWGAPEDIPVPADYDADYEIDAIYPPLYKADIAVWRPSTGTWYILKSGGSYATVQLGISGDVPLAAAPW